MARLPGLLVPRLFEITESFSDRGGGGVRRVSYSSTTHVGVASFWTNETEPLTAGSLVGQAIFLT